LNKHISAVFQALFVTLLWSTSWVLIKIGLHDIPPLTFAGLRYTFAALCLVPFALQRDSIRKLTARQWWQIVTLGVVFYSVTQGAQFLGLAYLPAATVNIMLNFTTVVVALLSFFVLQERLTSMQWIGVIISVIGAIVYFYPTHFPASEITGIAIMIVGILANAISSVMGRKVNRDGPRDSITVTSVSMSAGAILLLIGGITFQGMPSLSATNWGFILWLAVVNTALAFTLWNRSLQTLTAVESSVINNTMLIQIPILAWVFLGEALTTQKIIGMIIAGAGTLIVQMRPSRPP
jgi:drug/metabolite transporter (DMT)-like permease